MYFKWNVVETINNEYSCLNQDEKRFPNRKPYGIIEVHSIRLHGMLLNGLLCTVITKVSIKS